MKKVEQFLRPFMSIVLGTLLFLNFFNRLSLGGAALALGIIAVIFAAYYIAIGIISFVFGEKMYATSVGKVFDAITVCSFPVFMFVFFLLNLIGFHEQFGPNGWFVALFSMIISISAGLLLCLAAFIDHKGIKKASRLLGMVFLLALVLDVVFNRMNGNSKTLGEIEIVTFFIYVCFFDMMFGYFASSAKASIKKDEEAPAPVVEPEPEPKEEAKEEPQEEAPKAE